MIHLVLTPRDPVVARDGRPFGVGQGHHMRSLDWPYPSVLAGSLRTLLGKLRGTGFDADTVARLKEVQVSGPFPLTGDRLFLPAPRDIVFRRRKTATSDKAQPLEFFTRRPFEPQEQEGEGCNLPEGQLPLGLTESPGEDFKPASGPAFWSAEKMAEWLRDPYGKEFKPPPDPSDSNLKKRYSALLNHGFLDPPLKDRRTHVQLQPDTLAAKEGLLFSTTGLALAFDVDMAVRVQGSSDFAAAWDRLPSFHPLGGERRLVYWVQDTAISDQWQLPDPLKKALPGANGVRMVLASPGLFKDGWKPGWIGEDMVGTPPGTSVALRLKGAAIDRWVPLSGWSLEDGKVGPKPVRRLVPSGAVYFFTVERGNPIELADNLWLQSVCDREQDRNDGFGLTLWGVWDARGKKGEC